MDPGSQQKPGRSHSCLLLRLGHGTGLRLGEHQYYTAALHDMYLREESKPEDIYVVRDLAIDAYQALLIISGSVSYLADGETTFDLELACRNCRPGRDTGWQLLTLKTTRLPP